MLENGVSIINFYPVDKVSYTICTILSSIILYSPYSLYRSYVFSEISISIAYIKFVIIVVILPNVSLLIKDSFVSIISKYSLTLSRYSFLNTSINIVVSFIDYKINPNAVESS
jgi:hypothetical protein